MMKKSAYRLLAIILLITLAAGGTRSFSQPRGMTLKETVYVPAYSSIFHSDKKKEFNLTVTLSIHNVDTKKLIVIDTIDFYNTSGKKIRSYVAASGRNLKPLETYNLVIRESDVSGGVGGNFIVKWHAASPANSPVIETIMIGTRGQQGISFTSRGVTIEE